MQSFRVNHCTSKVLVLALCSLTATASLLTSRNDSKQWTFDQIPSSTNLLWYPCFSIYECAMLSVPLDYSKPNGSCATVPLIKIPAEKNSTIGKYQGMLLINPGGPGEAGVDFILTSGISSILPVVGTNFDIVSFDPRGMGRSLPRANCSQSASASGKVQRRAFGLAGPELPEAFWDDQFFNAKALGKECEAAIGGSKEAGRYMSTPVVATDMLSIVNAFAATASGKGANTNSSLLNYWGFSYGTFLGQTFASLYPDRVGRLAIDGVVDPEDYSSGQNLKDIIYVDAAVASFFTYCHLAGPILCPFYTGSSSSDIATRFENLFIPLNASYAIAQNWTNATVILESLPLIKNTIRLDTYSPITGFPVMAQQLVAFEQAIKNITAEAVEAAAAIGASDDEVPGTLPELQEYLPAVACTDSPSVYNQTYDEMKSDIETLEAQSFIGGDVWASIKVLCSGWPIVAAWRFSGPFGAKTKNPILYISNTIDPATPIDNSRKWSPQYTDSQILTIEAVGHTSLAANNSCANTKIGRFFQTGELPGTGTVCKVEAGAFGVTTDVYSASLFALGRGN